MHEWNYIPEISGRENVGGYPGATMPQHEIIFLEGKDRTFYYRCMAENTRKGYQPTVIASECIKPI